MAATNPDGAVSVFDRQIRIPDWNQDAISKQVALILGVGGLGCSLAISCARLGFRKLILVDFDVVVLHNLNRQILFGHSDVGKPKVEAAAEELRRKHVADPSYQIIETHSINAVTNWSIIVDLSREATMIFNAIDVGDYFDAAVSSLALKRKIPLIQGGTFRTTTTVDFYPPSGRPCWACAADVSDKDLIKKLRPELIESYQSLEFIPEDAKPTGASSAFVAIGCAQMMVNLAVNHICANLTPPQQDLSHFTPTRSIYYANNIDLDKWSLSAEPKCFFCSDDSQN